VALRRGRRRLVRGQEHHFFDQAATVPLDEDRGVGELGRATHGVATDEGGADAAVGEYPHVAADILRYRTKHGRTPDLVPSNPADAAAAPENDALIVQDACSVPCDTYYLGVGDEEGRDGGGSVRAPPGGLDRQERRTGAGGLDQSGDGDSARRCGESLLPPTDDGASVGDAVRRALPCTRVAVPEFVGKLTAGSAPSTRTSAG
jgi:hypothetical protein